MEDTTWEQGKLIGGIAAALAVLKWIVGRSRHAATDDRCDRKVEELRREMELAIEACKTLAKRETEHLTERIESNEQNAYEFRRRVLTMMDDLEANLKSLRRVVMNAPQDPPPASRLT